MEHKNNYEMITVERSFERIRPYRIVKFGPKPKRMKKFILNLNTPVSVSNFCDLTGFH